MVEQCDIVIDKTIVCNLVLREIDASVYSWNVNEEMNILGYGLPGETTIVDGPTGLAIYSGSGNTSLGLPSTIVKGSNSNNINLYVYWNADANNGDGHITAVCVQYRQSGTTNWVAWSDLSADATSCFIGPVSTSSKYDVRIRYRTVAGQYSEWVEVDNYSTGTLSSFSNTAQALDSGLLCASTISSTNCVLSLSDNPFSFYVQGTLYTVGSSVEQWPNMTPKTTYYAYIVTNALGNSTSTDTDVHITTNTADFANVSNAYYLDSITPSAGVEYYPSSASMDLGTESSNNPTNAYDRDFSSAAYINCTQQIVSVDTGKQDSNGDEIYADSLIGTWGGLYYSGFPAITTSSAMTLTLRYEYVAQIGSSCTVTLYTGSIVQGQGTVVGTVTAATSSKQAMTYTIPAGTNLASLLVMVQVTPNGTTTQGSSWLELFEIYIA